MLVISEQDAQFLTETLQEAITSGSPAEDELLECLGIVQGAESIDFDSYLEFNKSNRQ